ncbi:hypothetical protein [Actinoplanes sp. NPDC051859]|uniref:hypothetical protein n=1 Tax=Actinoplanes sp. NPDC051859 TaxID=3363909 RepID=UPI0037A190CC
MDRLAQLLDTAGPLLGRVDILLGAGGAPPTHEVWTQLRRVRLLPGDAARAVAALRPVDLSDAGPELRFSARSCATLAASLSPPKEWSGTAADAYDQARVRTAMHISGGGASVDDRLRATADLADALAHWMRRTRDDLAAALAEVIASAEALTLLAEGSDIPARGDLAAAADLAERVLRTVADAYDRAADLLHETRPLAEALEPAR